MFLNFAELDRRTRSVVDFEIRIRKKNRKIECCSKKDQGKNVWKKLAKLIDFFQFMRSNLKLLRKETLRLVWNMSTTSIQFHCELCKRMKYGNTPWLLIPGRYVFVRPGTVGVRKYKKQMIGCHWEAIVRQIIKKIIDDK